MLSSKRKGKSETKSFDADVVVHNHERRSDDQKDFALQKKNLNVSFGGLIYESAASRRSRHRIALMTSSENAVPLKRKQLISKRSISVGSTTTRAEETPNTQNSARKVFEDDRKDLDKELEWKAFERASVIRDADRRFSVPSKKREKSVAVLPHALSEPLRNHYLKGGPCSRQHSISRKIGQSKEKKRRKLMEGEGSSVIANTKHKVNRRNATWNNM